MVATGVATIVATKVATIVSNEVATILSNDVSMILTMEVATVATMPAVTTTMSKLAAVAASATMITSQVEEAREVGQQGEAPVAQKGAIVLHGAMYLMLEGVRIAICGGQSWLGQPGSSPLEDPPNLAREQATS